MADIVGPEKRSQMMAGIGAKNTKPEIIIRQILHRLGYRFRLHRKDLPGKPDIVLPKWKTVIFVHGCFWHGHENCQLFRLPKSRTEFWRNKISANQSRDQTVRDAYARTDWQIIEVWECATKGKSKLSFDDLGARLTAFIHSPKNDRRTIWGTPINQD